MLSKMGAQSRPKGLFSSSELGLACGPWGRGDGLHCWATQSHGFGLGLVNQAGTHMAKSLMKAILGISTSKATSLASSALLTTWLVMTQWEKREVTLQLTFKLWMTTPSTA